MNSGNVTLSFASVFADDLVALSGYYRTVFGLEPVTELDSPHFRGLHIGPTVLGFSAQSAYALLDLPAPIHGRDGVRSFLTFECAERDGVAARLAVALSHGGTLVQEAHRTYYGAWQAVARDPEGNAFRINYLPLDGGA